MIHSIVYENMQENSDAFMAINEGLSLKSGGMNVVCMHAFSWKCGITLTIHRNND